MSAPTAPVPPRWSDRGWDELWERTLDQVERHRYGLALWRGEVPDDALGRRVVPELAVRWRRRALVHAAAWLLFTVFWFLVGLAHVEQADGAPTTLVPWSCAGVGALVVLACLVARSRFGRVLPRDRPT